MQVLATRLDADSVSDLKCALFRKAVGYEVPFARLEYATYLRASGSPQEEIDVIGPDIAISDTIDAEIEALSRTS